MGDLTVKKIFILLLLILSGCSNIALGDSDITKYDYLLEQSYEDGQVGVFNSKGEVLATYGTVNGDIYLETYSHIRNVELEGENFREKIVYEKYFNGKFLPSKDIPYKVYDSIGEVIEYGIYSPTEKDKKYASKTLIRIMNNRDGYIEYLYKYSGDLNHELVTIWYNDNKVMKIFYEYISKNDTKIKFLEFNEYGETLEGHRYTLQQSYKINDIIDFKNMFETEDFSNLDLIDEVVYITIENTNVPYGQFVSKKETYSIDDNDFTPYINSYKRVEDYYIVFVKSSMIN